jgi:flagellar hook protein FlgE
MSLSSTLYSGLSGLIVNQTQLNVVGNNIANANTTAFKTSSVQFTPQFYVTENNGTPTAGTQGGSNPDQVGLGAQVAQISQNFGQGQLQNTGVPSNLAINGNGFFITQSASNNQQLYTRDGAFDLNSANQLVDSSGDLVQGYGVSPSFQVNPTTLQTITIPLGQETVAKATQNASLAGTLNAGGVVATQGTVLTSQALQDSTGPLTSGSFLVNLQNVSDGTSLYTAGTTLTLNAQQNGRALSTQTLPITSTTTVGDLTSFLQGGLGIDTTAQAGTNGTPGVSLVSGGGGTEIVATGNIGSENTITIPTGGLVDSNGVSALNLTQQNDTTDAANGESTNTSILAYDSLGNPVTLNVNTVLTGTSDSGTTWAFNVSSPQNEGVGASLGSGMLTFNTSGQLTGVTGNTVTLDRAGTGATASQNIDLNFSNVQALSGTSTTSDVVNTAQDGFPVGTLSSYAVGTDGTITGSFTNGQTETIGQVALATFANPDGLINQGNNQYAAGAASGPAVITAPTTQGAGTIQGGALEQSNVDLSQEFINLIIASTGYSASSRVISTSDQLLTALLNSQG